MESNDVGRIVGGIYIAISRALGDEAANVAHDVLRGFAENPDLQSEDRRVYACIVSAASGDPEALRTENARLDALASGPNLRLVSTSNKG